jgi:predicted nucleic acid-binding Zn ribbon protein
MPLYIYRCEEDGEVLEIKDTWKNVKDKPTIEKDGKLFKRVLQPFAPRFVGPGFHVNDYGKGNTG